MRVFIALFILTLARYSSAQVYGYGRCPDVRPVDDFDVHRYAGRWYEFARFYDAPEESFRCQTQNYTVKADYLLSNESGVDSYGQGYSFLVRIYNLSEGTQAYYTTLAKILSNS
ncbi:bilin-binding protein [Strongylocentrotus purpuratus]|uniref:Lipocalin/cytosolic fatty-acid binding domain-containing protein n=1 Tax=Strongylocentrotus purpuratus TaxID=7668 RepID=A0A7M7GHK8_STRPU|nr:bilin-binding protein [Strongylocentrotus purpuratus]